MQTPQQVLCAEYKAEEEEAYNHLSYAIENGGSSSDLFDNLPTDQKSTILKRKDRHSRNAFLKTVYHGNVGLFAKLLPLLALLQLQDLLLENDIENQNVIHLALLSGSVEMFYKVLHYLKTDPIRYTVSDQILQRNHSDNNALALALHMPEEGVKLVNEHLLPFLEISVENIKSLIQGNAISNSVMTNNFDIALKLTSEVERHSGGDRYTHLKTLFIEPQHQDVSYTENLGKIQQPHEEKMSLLEMLIERITPHNEEDINLIINILFNSANVNDLYDMLVVPLENSREQILSLLIRNDCHELIRKLLENKWLAKKIWDQMSELQRNSHFSRQLLESHAMTARMVAVFNQSSSIFFLNLSDHSKAKPLCLLFYSEQHTDRYADKNRDGAEEECTMLKDALVNTGVSCEEMPQNGKIWIWKQVKRWMEQTLKSWKDRVSQLFIAGFCHGADGLLCDADMAPCPISDIIKAANESMYRGIPITFMFQGCRMPISVGSTPTLKLERYNLAIMTCSEGQSSRRGRYTKWFAKRLKDGERNIEHIHADVSNVMKQEGDTDETTPEIRSMLTKRELSLPLPNSQ